MPEANFATDPFTLQSPYGTTTFNTGIVSSGNPNADGKILIKEGCRMGFPGIRSTKDDVPQGDGSVLHQRFFPGYEAQVTCQFYDDGKAMCGEALQDELDALLLHLGAMIKSEFPGRLLWTPEGKPIRMLDYARTAAIGSLEYPSSMAQFSFTIDTEFPYAIDFTQTSTAISGSTVIAQGGNTPFYPVFQVTGGGAFTISNDTTGLAIVYAGSYSGYAEIDTFREVIYENGDGANLKSGLDMENTDFFSLVPGNNVITVSGGTATMLYQNAWI